MLVKADVSESSEVERMAAQTGEAFGSIAMLVAGAGIGYIRSHAKLPTKRIGARWPSISMGPNGLPRFATVEKSAGLFEPCASVDFRPRLCPVD